MSLLRAHPVLGAGLAMAAGVTLLLVRRYEAPDAVASRLCRARYAFAGTAPDTAALDSIRTLTRGRVIAPHTCGELRFASRR
jgi:hypothetical protein